MLRKDSRARLRHRDEGSIILALLVIMVLFIICSAVAVSVVDNQGVASGRQNISSAVVTADAGLADAIFRIDQGTPATGGGTSFCVSPHCSTTALPYAPGVSYIAQETATPQSEIWTVNSLATANRQQGAVQELVVGIRAAAFALFANKSADLPGGDPAAFSVYNSACPIANGTAPSASCPATNPGTGQTSAVGSNGTLSCNGQGMGNVALQYWDRNSVPSSCSASGGATNPSSSAYQFAPIVLPSGSCPSNGTFTSPIPAGTYVCNTPVTLSGNVSVTGPVKIFVAPSVGGSSTPAVNITGCINDNYDTADGCPSPVSLPKSPDLQIFYGGSADTSIASGSAFAGLIYAPNTTVRLNGCKADLWGSFVVGTFTCKGGGNSNPTFKLRLHYDSNLGNAVTNWVTQGYTVMNPQTVAALIP